MMIGTEQLRIYLALKKPAERSHMEDTLVLDGFDVRAFGRASELWAAFQEKPARLIITERRFNDGFTGLELAQHIRKHYMLPYVYIVVLSVMKQLDEIKEGLAAGADDYLLKPHNPSQLRSRILVGMRWLTYLDSLYASKSAK